VRRILKWLLLVVLAVTAYLLLWPTPLDPYAWTPPPNPGTGPDSPFRPTQDLEVRAAFAGHLIGTFNDKAGRPVNFGPEDVAVSPRDGRIYTGLGDGRILRIDPRGGPVEVFADTGGRPLGVTFDASGERLYVSDALLGLLSVDLEGRVTVLADQAQGEPVTFADNLDVARDGTIWFSAPTRDHSLAEVELDVWDSRPSGRLLQYDPATGQAKVVLDNLFYANGVALAADESFVLVAEFLAFRIVRYWLAGPRAGSHEIFVEGLPGYPDNITRTPDGHFLVGLSLQRIPGLDAQRARPWAVKVLYRLPAFLKPKAQYPGYLMEFDAQGQLRRFAADETRDVVAQVTSGTVLPSQAPGAAGAVVVGSLLVPSVRQLRLQPTD
jgi:sugar lactone lactonase YvrE